MTYADLYKTAVAVEGVPVDTPTLTTGVEATVCALLLLAKQCQGQSATTNNMRLAAALLQKLASLFIL